MYTDWNIICTLKPEYIELIDNFIKTSDFPKDEDIPHFITKWQEYLKRICRYYTNQNEEIDEVEENEEIDEFYEVYMYNPPFGISGIWGYKNELNGNCWSFSGAMKNYNDEIQVFLVKVLAPLTESIDQCWISSEWRRDSCKPKFSESDSEDESHIYHITDSDIRTHTWRKLMI